MAKNHRNHSVIFDVLYGFIPVTDWEAAIIDSPFYQRLRWIKQLGFSNYIFPGAEHNRFAHAIGVMHSMQKMIEACGIAVPNERLFDKNATDPETLLHKSLRVSALLHDIGTFPFSHAVEYAYIRHGVDDRRDRDSKQLPNSHEHLGSFIIKNTDYEGGLTRILQDANLDIQLISRIIKGDSPHMIANQLMHSDLDADRMDYLLRDSHYTGIKYGQYDRDYILANLATFELPDGNVGFGVREHALHAVEDYLVARFSWYSQVIKNPGSAKFDVMASHVARSFLENDLIYQFQDLLQMIEDRDERFFWFNDLYFMSRCYEIHIKKGIKDPRAAELTEMLLYRKPPKTVRHEALAHRYLPDHGKGIRAQLISDLESLSDTFNELLEKKGTGAEWILMDIPHKDVAFTSGYQKLQKTKDPKTLYAERDPIKLIDSQGNPSLLIEHENTLMTHLGGLINFVPACYANEAAIRLLRKHQLI